MRLWVAVACDDAVTTARVRGFVREHWQAFFPAGAARMRLGDESGDANAFVHLWTDEPIPTPMTRNRELVFAYSGYARFEGLRAASFFERYLSVGSGGPRLSRPTGGIAAFCAVQEHPALVYAWSTQPPVEPVYFARGAGFTVVSNRPLAAHLTARLSTEPELDVDHLPAYLSCGYSLAGDLPFRGVRIVPPYRAVIARPDRVELIAHPNPPIDRVPKERFKDTVRRGVAAIGDAVASVPVDGAELMLSGGKDSRLLIAALVGHKRRPLVTTYDVKGPDNTVAVMVAERLRLRCTVIDPSFQPAAFEAAVIENLRRAHGVPNPEAQVQAAIPLRSLGDGAPILLGHHQLQKGGWAGFAQRPFGPETARTVLHERFANPFVRPEIAAQAVGRHLDAWLDTRVGESALETLFWATHDFRVSRWLLGHAHAYAERWRPIYPLVDESFARFLATAPITQLRNEALMFGMIAKMSPKLRDVPLASKRWKFESAARDMRFLRGWERRAPVTGTNEAAAQVSFWTGNDAIWTRVRDTILSSPVIDSVREIVAPDMLAHIENWRPGEPFSRRNRSARLPVAFTWRLFECALLYAKVPFR